MVDFQKPEAQAVAELVEKYHQVELLQVTDPHPETPEGISVAVVPKGMELRSLKQFVDEHLDEPRRRKGVARFTDLVSFIGHANRFKDKDSAIFASPGSPPSLTSVLDYHRAGDRTPRFGEHRGLYTFPISDEWQAWIDASGSDSAMSQTDFAEFLEDHIVDVADPASAGEAAKGLAQSIGATLASPAKLLELSRGLSISVASRVQNAVKLASGETQINYATEHRDEQGAPLKVPGAFLLAIPVFRNGAAYQIPVRLRYRVSGGAITWHFEMHRSEAAFDHAFKEACAKAAEETALPLFFGTPE